jgi:hypothetical protein
MATIVEYSDTKAPENLYPTRIVSPSRSGPCCFSDMETIGELHQDGNWMCQYKRCRTCGYAVRVVVRELPNEALIADLRKILEVSFQRNVPDY